MCWNLGGISRNVQHLGRGEPREQDVLGVVPVQALQLLRCTENQEEDSRESLHHEQMGLSGRTCNNKRAKRWSIHLFNSRKAVVLRSTDILFV